MPHKLSLDNAPLLQVYDQYSDFVEERYFALRYGFVPSKIELEVPIARNRKNVEQLNTTLDLATHGLSEVLRDWEIAKNSNATEENDFADYRLYESATVPLLLRTDVYTGSSSVKYYYDRRAPGLEEYVVARIRSLRAALGQPRSPVFRVLTKDRGSFTTERVNIKPFDIDLGTHYNDDFAGVHQLINTSIGAEQSGLILLHGVPGTGKTSYIKKLMSDHLETKFIFIPNDFVGEILQPEFVTFLLGQKKSVLVIEDAESVIMDRRSGDKRSIVSTILQITDGLFSDYLNIKVICTFNVDVSKIDKALFRKGRMIAFYEFGELSENKARSLLAASGRSGLPARRTLAELYNHGERSFEEDVEERTIGFR